MGSLANTSRILAVIAIQDGVFDLVRDVPERDVHLVASSTALVVRSDLHPAIVTLLEEMREKGRLAMVVHHDLDSAREYFDSILLLNMRVVACGPTEQVFTSELLRKTYGGRLTILSDVSEAVAQAQR